MGENNYYITTTLEGLAAILDDMASVDPDDRPVEAIRVFNWLYMTGKDSVEWTDAERKAIGLSLDPFLSDLVERIDTETTHLPTGGFWTSCMIRSAVQFLLDDFSRYLPSLNLFQEQLDLEEYDDRLVNYRPYYPIDMDEEEATAETNYLPPHHKTWWHRISTY